MIKSTSFSIALIILLSCMSLSCWAKEKAQLSIALRWELKEGKTGEKIFPPAELSSLYGKGLWVAFKKDGDIINPGISLGGKFLRSDIPLEQVTALSLEVKILESGKEKLKKNSILFDEKRPVGSRMVSSENVYHLLVLNDFVDSSVLPSSLGKNDPPAPEWEGPFFRTHRLAMNYAVQSDEKAQEIAKVLEVKASYGLPRLILVAEELLVVNVEKEGEKKKSGGGLFGFDLEAEMEGKNEKEEKEVETKKIPTYSIDVMNDDIVAEGKYSAGFQNARSLWNDIVEGKVIYEASEGKRRVITATIVFSQMQKNIAMRNSKNRVFSVDARSTEKLDNCENLWPLAKERIVRFLKGNPGWKVIIPQMPVTFYQDDKPLYDMYAWYRVHPESGRMVGMLPNRMRGAISDEWEKFEKKAVEKGQEAATKVAGTSVILAFGQQIAGMYVAAGGIIEGISITFCDPKIAALSEKEWLKFLSLHALDFCSKFMEEHADFYDNYAVMLSFWQGAVTMAGLLGGKDAVEDGARRAIEGVMNKAEEDARKWANEKLDELKEGAMKELENIAGDYVPTSEDIDDIADDATKKFLKQVNETVEAVDKASEIAGKVEETAEKVKEVYDRGNAVKEEIKQGLRSRGSN